jgi:hypothetical protein
MSLALHDLSSQGVPTVPECVRPRGAGARLAVRHSASPAYSRIDRCPCRLAQDPHQGESGHSNIGPAGAHRSEDVFGGPTTSSSPTDTASLRNRRGMATPLRGTARTFWAAGASPIRSCSRRLRPDVTLSRGSDGNPARVEGCRSTRGSTPIPRALDDLGPTQPSQGVARQARGSLWVSALLRVPLCHAVKARGP